MPASLFKLAPNIPVTMTIRFVDVFPNDTTKNDGKGYGASLALTGTIDGKESRIYPKGFVDRNLQKLMQANVIDLGNYSDDPTEKYSIPVLDGDDIQLELEQPAGERYPAFVARNPRQFGATPAPKPGRETPKDDGYLDALVSQDGVNVATSSEMTLAAPPRIDDIKRMTNCFGHAITIIKNAAQLSGLTFTGEDVRSTAISLFIGGAGR